MKKFQFVINTLAIAMFTLVFVSIAQGQATRTWVSGVGDDVNPCSRTAPCKTFAGAISKTAAAGQINCLDPGGFGGVTIIKSIGIQCDNTEAGVLVSGTNGIVINAGANDVVFLSGLDIQGVGTGLNGISFIGGKALHVRNTTIRGFATNGINFAPANASASLVVQDSVVADNPNAAGGGGILIKPAAGFNAAATLTNVHMDRNLFGLRAEDRSKVNIFGSTAASNTNNGILAASVAAGAVEINIAGTIISHNGINGVSVSGGAATIRLRGCDIHNNGIGINTNAGGTIAGTTPGSNSISGNTTDGAVNGNVVLQ
jgi:hypothetical protein